jgi:hypothetical protein
MGGEFQEGSDPERAGHQPRVCRPGSGKRTIRLARFRMLPAPILRESLRAGMALAMNDRPTPIRAPVGPITTAAEWRSKTPPIAKV